MMFQLNDKASSQVATHVMVLLSEHIDLMLAKMPDLPVKILEVMTFCWLFLRLLNKMQLITMLSI